MNKWPCANLGMLELHSHKAPTKVTEEFICFVWFNLIIFHKVPVAVEMSVSAFGGIIAILPYSP